MSLNFDTTKIADKEFITRMGSDVPGVMEDPTKEYWSHEITAVIHWCMVTDIGTITEANYETWYNRYVSWMLACGYPKDEWFITLEMVRKSVGLSTNVFNTTDAAFAKRLRARIQETASNEVRRQRKALDEPTSEV